MLKVKRGVGQPAAADLLIETVGFQALEDHRVHHGVGTVPCPLPGNDARGAQTGEQVIHQAEDLTWWTRRGREGGEEKKNYLCTFYLLFFLFNKSKPRAFAPRHRKHADNQK